MMEKENMNDDEFKVELLKVLGEIRDELKKDSYVNIKPSTINITTGEINDETISNVKALIESQRKNIGDSLKKLGIGRNPLDYGI